MSVTIVSSVLCVLWIRFLGTSASRAHRGSQAIALLTQRSEAIMGNVTENRVLKDVFNQMKVYRSTPWYSKERKDKNSTSWEPYQWGMLDYRQFPKNVPVAREPFTSVDGSECRIKYMNAHAGDLLEHSKWTALQLALWKKDGSFWVDGVDVGFAIVIGLVHDIVKGADCSFTCVRGRSGENRVPGALDTFQVAELGPVKQRMHCYLDTYSQLKYKGQNDLWHAYYVGNFLETAIPSQHKNGLSLNNQFWRKCPSVNELRAMWRSKNLANQGSVRLSSESGGALGNNVAAVLLALNEWKETHAGYALTAKHLLHELVGSDHWKIYQIAFVGRFHWEVGRMNFGKGATRPTTKLSPRAYLNLFAAQIQEFAECGSECSGLDDASCRRGRHCLSLDGKVPIFDACDDKATTRKLLQLSLAVAAADIAGSSPSRDWETGTRDGEQEQFSDEGVGKEANLVTDKTNAAKKICKSVEDKDESLQNHFTDYEIQMLTLACRAGCRDAGSDSYTCHTDQRYPALDVWSAPLPTSFVVHQREYYDSVMSLFDEVAASDDEYNLWCKRRKVDMQDAEKLYHMGIGTSCATCEPNASAEVVFGLYSLAMNRYERDACISYCHDDSGDDGMGFFKLGTSKGELDAQIACSVPQAVTLPAEARELAMIPAKATSFSWLYSHPSVPDLGQYGAFVYFGEKDERTDTFPVLGINVLYGEIRASSTEYKIAFEKPADVPADAYNILREVIKSEGITLNPKNKGFGFNLYDEEHMPGVYRYAWYPPGLGFGLAEHGGFVFSTNPADKATEIANGPGLVEY